MTHHCPTCGQLMTGYSAGTTTVAEFDRPVEQVPSYRAEPCGCPITVRLGSTGPTFESAPELPA